VRKPVNYDMPLVDIVHISVGPLLSGGIPVISSEFIERGGV